MSNCKHFPDADDECLVCRDAEHFVLGGTINFDTRTEEFVVSDPRTLGEIQDAISVIIDDKPQATSFVFCVVRKHV
jgi:hypothetical protein